MLGRPRPQDVSTRLLRIAKLAREMQGTALTTLAHHIDIEFLREAFRRTRKDGAVGVDGRTARQYERHLEVNLQNLLDRFKSGTYRAPPVRRVHIPKGDGSKTRPIGIPTFEDKLLQRAVSMVLGAIYEQDFMDCSYAFRPKRSAHQALERIWKGLMDMGGGWVLEADIKSFFDAIDHGHLRSFLDQRVRDGVIRRSIDKWLKAGVMEEGLLTHPDTGSPQGGVISPILANIYLHEVLDKWFEETVLPLMRGPAFLVRYADDFVMVFALESDARRVYKVLAKRFAKYGLTIHPEKTRLVEFKRPWSNGRTRTVESKQAKRGTFELLGFCHFWAQTRTGRWVVRQRTAPSRFTRALKKVAEWCRRHRHRPIAEQRQDLIRKLRGHYEYYGITGNSWALSRFRGEVVRLWRQWLSRRSQRSRMTKEKFKRLLERYPIPPARCVHSVVKA